MHKSLRGIAMLLTLVGSISSSIALNAQVPPPPPPAASPAPAAAASTMSADDIVAKYITAIGGNAAVAQVKSVSMETAAQVMGNDATGTTQILDGVGYKSDTVFNGADIVQCYTAKGGWLVNPMAGISDPSPMPDDQYVLGKDQIYVGGPLFNYATKGSKVAVTSQDKDTYTVKLTTKDGVDSTYIFDAATFLVRSMTRKGKMQDQDLDITSTYTDYRKAEGGFLLPYSINVDFGGQFQVAITVKKIDVNKTIDPSVFDMPKAAKS
jgi:hypothetical protein